MIIRSRRSYGCLAVSIVLAGLFFAPVSQSVRVPAVLHAAEEANIFPPHQGELRDLMVTPDERVEAGQVLARLHSSQLLLTLDLTEKRIALLRKKLDRMGADKTDLSNRTLLEAELEGELEELAVQKRSRDALTVRAAISGVIVDMDPELHVGRSIGERSQMFRIKGDARFNLTGLVNERDVARIDVGAAGVFYPDNLQLASVPVVLKSISSTAFKTFKFPSLAAPFGGGVAVEEAPAAVRTLRIAGGYFGIDAVAAPSSANSFDAIWFQQTQRGVVKFEAQGRSAAQAVWSRIVSVLRRETGF